MVIDVHLWYAVYKDIYKRTTILFSEEEDFGDEYVCMIKTMIFDDKLMTNRRIFESDYVKCNISVNICVKYILERKKTELNICPSISQK